MEIRYEPDFFSCDPTRLFSAFSAPLREAVFLRFHSLLPVALSPTVCFHAAPPSRRGGAPYLQHVTEYQAAGSLRALLPKNILCGEVAPLRETAFLRLHSPSSVAWSPRFVFSRKAAESQGREPLKSIA